MRLTFLWLALMASVALTGTSVTACNIPVFRYALENWEPDPYQVFVLYEGELDVAQQALLDRLVAATTDNAKPRVNMVVHPISDERDAPADEGERRSDWAPGTLTYLAEWRKKNSTSQPAIVALYPRRAPGGLPAWHAELTEANVGNLIDSPMRQELAKRIVDGQSAVWVFIESGNQEKDDQAFGELESWLERMPQEVSLPDMSLIESDDEYRPEVPIELKVSFSALRIDPKDPQEQALASMLLGSEDDLREFDEPVAIPVYGRGRTYFALVGQGISEENVRDNCQFICGACSCQVKQENPGIDLLLAVDWESQVLGSAMPDNPLPELTGVGGFEFPSDDVDAVVPTAQQAPEGGDGTPVAMVTGPPEIDLAAGPQAEPASPASRSRSGTFEVRLLFGVAGLLVVGVFFLAGLTLLIRRRSDAG